MNAMQLKSFEQLCHYATNICLKDPIKSALVFQLLTFGDYEKTARNRVEKLRAGSAHVLFRPLIPHFSGHKKETLKMEDLLRKS